MDHRLSAAEPSTPRTIPESRATAGALAAGAATAVLLFAIAAIAGLVATHW